MTLRSSDRALIEWLHKGVKLIRQNSIGRSIIIDGDWGVFSQSRVQISTLYKYMLCTFLLHIEKIKINSMAGFLVSLTRT